MKWIHKQSEKQGKVIPFEQGGDFFLKRGSQWMERNNLLDAIANYRKALKREPDNINYQLALAEVFTEMRRYEESNRILFHLLTRDDRPADCYFGMACNFIGLQDFDHASDSLESYLTLEPDGEYAIEALDMLSVMEDEDALFSISGIQNEKEQGAARLCAQGRNLMEIGQIQKAIPLLEQAVEQYPDYVFTRNNLSMAYFCAKDFEKAMHQVRESLNIQPLNIQAHCNLLLFLHAAKDDEGVQREKAFVLNAKTQDPDDLNRLAVVMMELECPQDALRVLKRLHSILPYDEQTLHRLGVCYHRLGNDTYALECYNRLLKIDPEDSIARYYRSLCRKAIAGDAEQVTWLYHYQVPYQEAAKRIQYLNECIGKPIHELQTMWDEDTRFQMMIRWGLKLPDADAKRVLLMLLGSLKSNTAERVLRDFLLTKEQPDESKREVIAMLKRAGAREPYLVYLDGQLVQSRVSFSQFLLPEDLPLAYQRVLHVLLETTQGVRDNRCIASAIQIYKQFLKKQKGYPQLRGPQVQAIAAALDYLGCHECGETITKTQLCSAYGVSLVRFNNALGKVIRTTESEQ